MSFQNMELRFSGSLTIRCNAQIVHRTVKEKDADEPSVRYGFAYTDMPIEDHMALQNILHRTDNPNTRICSSVDNDNLWSFFFETGFIYSKKYHEFNSKKHRIKSVYDRLYNQPLDVSRHFTYQENGKILGHLSMLRFCNNAWLIHHHAALKKSGIKAGLAVLNQVARFSYNSIWLDACHMGYMYCYFRPENEFPNFFFNGFAERLNDRNGCSTDAFAYYTHKAPSAMTTMLPQDWALDTATREDLTILAEHYSKRSGGLMVDAFDLGPSAMPQDELTLKYRNAGLKKERAVLSLRKQGKLAAVFLVNNADEALNMSDLTSCVHAMVVDESLLPKELLSTALNMLSRMFEGNRFPVLLYPFFYAEDQQIPYQKKYVLWILSTRYSDHYFGYLDQVNSLSTNNR